LPKRNDHVVIGNLSITVVRADSRRLHSILVEILPEEPFPIEST
jgi:magnesium and cobalt transporter